MNGKERGWTVAVVTFGCQMNEHDSERVTGLLAREGFAVVRDPLEADVVLFNTCCVRAKAEQKFYSKMGRIVFARRDKPPVIGVLGCIAQKEKEKLPAKYPRIKLVIGSREIHRLPELLLDVMRNRRRTVAADLENQPLPEGRIAVRESRIKAYVTVMEGCDNFCSYCIVPFVRGRERSRPVADILLEAEDLVKRGYKEVTLLGQNVNSYRDPGADGFPGLLKMVGQTPGIERVRFTTSHPKDFSEPLAEVMAGVPTVCAWLHLAVQAGSNSVLERMNRKYTRERYLSNVNIIRGLVPNVAITTDIIAGFCGETEEEFRQTMNLVEEVRFDGAFTFCYSVRSGTSAAELEDDIPRGVKVRRLQELNELLRTIAREKNDLYIGRDEEVLVEGPSLTDKNLLTGRTGTNKIVNFKGDADFIGELIPVRITGATPYFLTGRQNGREKR